MTEEDSVQEKRQSSRPCPVCGETMDSENKYLNEVEVCENHGIWLEKGQLESIVARVKRTRRRTSQEAISEARKEGMLEMWFFGPIAFLFDRLGRRKRRRRSRKE